MREIIFREFQSRDRFAFLNFDWSSRSLFFNSFFRGFLYWQNDVEKFSIKFISIPRKDIGFFRSFEDPNLKSDTPLIEGKEKKRFNPFRPIVPPPLEELGNCGQLTRIFNSVIIGRSRWYFEGKVFHASQREKLLTPFKFHPSWNRNFCHAPSRWNYVSTLCNISFFFPWTGWRRSVRRIGERKFKYSRQIQNPSSLTRATLGEKDRR